MKQTVENFKDITHFSPGALQMFELICPSSWTLPLYY